MKKKVIHKRFKGRMFGKTPYTACGIYAGALSYKQLGGSLKWEDVTCKRCLKTRRAK